MRSPARSRCAARGPGRCCRSGSTRSSRGSWGVTFGGAGPPDRLGARRRHRPSRRPLGPSGSVPRRARDAAGGAGHPLDDPAAAVRRQHRLQGARRRDDPVSADLGRRRALLRRRRPRRPGRRRGLGHGDRGPGRGAGHARPARRPRAGVAACPDRRRLARPSASTSTSAGRRRSPSTGCSTLMGREHGLAPDRGARLRVRRRRPPRHPGREPGARRARGPARRRLGDRRRLDGAGRSGSAGFAGAGADERAAQALARARRERLPPPRRGDRGARASGRIRASGSSPRQA